MIFCPDLLSEFKRFPVFNYLWWRLYWCCEFLVLIMATYNWPCTNNASFKMAPTSSDLEPCWLLLRTRVWWEIDVSKWREVLHRLEPDQFSKQRQRLQDYFKKQFQHWQNCYGAIWLPSTFHLLSLSGDKIAKQHYYDASF